MEISLFKMKEYMAKKGKNVDSIKGFEELYRENPNIAQEFFIKMFPDFTEEQVIRTILTEELELEEMIEYMRWKGKPDIATDGFKEMYLINPQNAKEYFFNMFPLFVDEREMKEKDMFKIVSDEYYDQEQLELIELNEKAENTVVLAVAATTATGAMPIPFADAPLLITEQVTMMATICGIYGIDVEKEGLKMLALAAIGVSGATLLGKTIVANLIKIFPGTGTAVGGVFSAGTAGIITFAMGKAFIEVCKMVKLGELSEYEMFSDKGKKIMEKEFRRNCLRQKSEE